MSHYYNNRGELVQPWAVAAWPSPTTILSIIAKPELDQWRKDYDRVHGEGAADERTRIAQERGTRVHKLCEEWMDGKRIEFEDFDDIDYFIGFQNWCEKVKPEVLDTEIFLESKKYKYRGRCDLVVRIDGQLWIIDLKTGSFRWSHGYQLRAYEQAHFESTEQHARMGVLGLTNKNKQCYHRVKETHVPLINFVALKMVFDDYMAAHPIKQPTAPKAIWAPSI